ncbi:uncharacterized protein LOC125656467 [Ostrea edulis]|uniref:uncharacterized protein LOC125656467 n=1 Tax=Ostrea edulis TaxID=37623 RepID=UPI0024AEE643|nr:uncharacterized protein LOC125656467 [Ostrea edulis]
MKECQKDGGYLVRVTSPAKHDEVNGFDASMSSFGLIRSNVLGSEFQFQLYQITNGLVSELIIHTDEQIPKLSEVGCARACAKQNGCLSLIFDSEAGRCSLLSRGILQNSSKPEIPYYIKVYTRRVEKCSHFGYQDLSVSRTCIKVYSETRSQPDAMKKCQKDGGYLVRLTSQAKHDEVDDFVASMSSLGFFIDGSDADKEDEWRLSDGSPLYLHWSPWEPNICCKLIEHCVIMFTNGDYNDIGCSSSHSFICEIDTLPVV